MREKKVLSLLLNTHIAKSFAPLQSLHPSHGIPNVATVLHACNKDNGNFQSQGSMQCHEGHSINVVFQIHPHQKPAPPPPEIPKEPFFVIIFAIFMCGIHQFLDVCNAVFRFLPSDSRRNSLYFASSITRQTISSTGDFGNHCKLAMSFGKSFTNRGVLPLISGITSTFRTALKKASALRCRPASQFFNGSISYAARGCIDYAFQRHLVVGINTESEIRQNIFNFLPLIESPHPDNRVRNAVISHTSSTRIGHWCVKQRNIRIFCILTGKFLISLISWASPCSFTGDYLELHLKIFSVQRFFCFRYLFWLE